MVSGTVTKEQRAGNGHAECLTPCALTYPKRTSRRDRGGAEEYKRKKKREKGERKVSQLLTFFPLPFSFFFRSASLRENILE